MLACFAAGRTRGRDAALFGGLAAVNLTLWLFAFACARHAPALLASAFAAYGFGLRHAVDADHIAAIDNVTRKLMQDGRRPSTVGLFFALGHSTVVFALAALAGRGAVALNTHLAGLETFGGLFGTAISVGFLAIMALANARVLVALLRVRRGAPGIASLAPGGPLARLFSPVFGLIQAPWQMYPVGFLFGLGFDTATEIGLLTLAAAGGARGVSFWAIMLLPALFTAGMALVDTADGALMRGAYGWAFVDPARKLSYNIAVTSLSIAVAAGVGAVETLGVLQSERGGTGRAWHAIAMLNNNFGLLGAAIIAAFILAWALSAGRIIRPAPAR